MNVRWLGFLIPISAFVLSGCTGSTKTKFGTMVDHIDFVNPTTSFGTNTGGKFSATVAVLDNTGTKVAGVSGSGYGTVTLGAYTDASCKTPASGNLTGNLSTAFGTGTATFSNINYDTIGSIFLGASFTMDTGSYKACSKQINIGSLDHIGFVPPIPGTVSTDSTFAVDVQLYDSFGGAISGSAYSGTITLSAWTDSSCSLSAAAGNLSGASASVNSGTQDAFFPSVKYDTVTASGIYLLASYTSGPNTYTACSSKIVFTAGVLDHITFTQPTGTSAIPVIAGANFPTVQVTAYDSHNNVIPGVSVTIGAFNSSTCAPANAVAGLGGTTTAAGNASGVSSYNNLSFQTAGPLWLQANASGVSPVCSLFNFTIMPSAANHLAFSNPTGSGVYSVAVSQLFNPNVQVTAYDQYNNIVPGVNVTINGWTASNCGSGAVGLGGTLTSATNPAGAAIFTPSYGAVAANIYVQATASGVSALCSTFSYQVTSGPLNRLAFIAPATGSSLQAGTPFPTITVVGYDAGNSPITGINASIAPFKDSNCSQAAGTFTGTTTGTLNDAAGVSYTGITYNTVISPLYIQASAAGVTACSPFSFSIVPGPLNHIAFTQPGAGAFTVQAGMPFTTVQTTAYDAFGNVIQGTTISLTASSNNLCSNTVAGLSGTTSGATNANGNVSYGNLSYSPAGTPIWLKASAAGVPAPCSPFSFNIVPGAINSLTFTSPAAGTYTIQAGNPFTAITVNAKDSGGSAVSGAPVTIAAYSDGSCSTLITVSGITSGSTDTSGNISFANLTYDVAGKQVWVKANSGGSVFSSCSPFSFSIQAAALNRIAFTAPAPGNYGALAGVSFSPSIKANAYDAFSNPISGVAITVAAYNTTFTAPIAGLNGTLTVNTDATGTAAFSNLNHHIAGTVLGLQATAAGVPAFNSQFTFTISAGAPTHLAFNQPITGSTVQVARLFPNVQVAALDAYGNTVQGVTVNILPYDAGCANQKGTFAPGSTTTGVTNSSGAVNFSNLTYQTANLQLYIQASATGLTNACTPFGFNMTPGALNHISFTSPNTTNTYSIGAGNPFSPAAVVTAYDIYNNTISGTNITVSGYTDNQCSQATIPALGGTLAIPTDGSGNASFTTLTFTQANKTIYLAASASGVTPKCSQFSYAITANVPNSIKFASPTSNQTVAVNALFNSSVTIFDVYGNVVPQAGLSVSLSATNNTCGSTIALSGTTTASTLSNGTALFSTSYGIAGVIYLKASYSTFTTCSALASNTVSNAAFSINVVAPPPPVGITFAGYDFNNSCHTFDPPVSLVGLCDDISTTASETGSRGIVPNAASINQSSPVQTIGGLSGYQALGTSNTSGITQKVLLVKGTCVAGNTVTVQYDPTITPATDLLNNRMQNAIFNMEDPLIQPTVSAVDPRIATTTCAGNNTFQIKLEFLDGPATRNVLFSQSIGSLSSQVNNVSILIGHTGVQAADLDTARATSSYGLSAVGFSVASIPGGGIVVGGAFNKTNQPNPATVCPNAVSAGGCITNGVTKVDYGFTVDSGFVGFHGGTSGGTSGNVKGVARVMLNPNDPVVTNRHAIVAFGTWANWDGIQFSNDVVRLLQEGSGAWDSGFQGIDTGFNPAQVPLANLAGYDQSINAIGREVFTPPLVTSQSLYWPDSANAYILAGDFSHYNNAVQGGLSRMRESDGHFDPNFGPNQTSWGPVNGNLHGVLILPNGKLLIYGTMTSWTDAQGNNPCKGLCLLDNNGVYLIDANDPSHFNLHAANVMVGNSTYINAVVLTTTGKLILGGNFQGWGADSIDSIAMIDSLTGLPDSTFNSKCISGLRQGTTTPATVQAIALQPDGSVLFAGNQKIGCDGVLQYNNLVRLYFDSSSNSWKNDTGFTPNISSNVNDISIGEDGSFVIVGNFSTITTSANITAKHVARFKHNP